MASVASVIGSFAESIAHVLDVATERAYPYEIDGAHIPQAHAEQKVKEIRDLIHNPAFTLQDLPAYWDAISHANTVGLDDRQLLLEKVLVLMSRLDRGHDDISMRIQKVVIDLLYNDLPHPPASYLGPYNNQTPLLATSAEHVKYAFRSADGSNYNPLFPNLGSAGSPYARSVPAIRSAPKHVLPDPGLVFDTLLRRDEFTPHPGGISGLFFAYADLIIHSVFHTDHSDWATNKTSSYLDLSILYGDSQREQDQVRRKDGSGKLWDDVFADARLLLMPPASCALLVLYSRNHNYIAQKLLDINENGTFVSPPPTDEKKRLQQDDELFHRARLVNCGYFLKVILGDYVGAILGLVVDESSWRLDPMMSSRNANHEISPRGEGNVVSIEFNLLYRWHATLSDRDTKWTENLFKRILDGKDPSEITPREFIMAAHNNMISDGDIKDRSFGGLTRGSDRRFKDDDLARIIQDATESPAAAFKARGIPAALRVVEVLGIEQSRSWGTCSLNEFRKFLGLKPYSNFKEWNPDPEIHTAAATLYKDIDNLELHVGLQAEQAKKPGPGAGLCPGYTISRAILADAVSLTRGDPFLTTQFTPFNLTKWGYDDCQYDAKDGSYGGMLTKLLFRTLPDHFPVGSAYAHFPFLVPHFMRNNLVEKKSDIVTKYTWTRPPPPTQTVVVDTYAGVGQVLKDPHFLSADNGRLLNVVTTSLEVTESENDKSFSRRVALEKLLPFSHSSGTATWAAYFKQKTQFLISSKSMRHIGGPTKYVDIIQDVINLLPVHLISEKLIGLPLKTVTHPDELWYEQDVYQEFANVGRYVFSNLDPADDWRLRESSRDTYKKISKYIKGHLNSSNSRITTLIHTAGIYDSGEFVKRARDSHPDASVEELSADIFAAVVPTSAYFSQIIAQAVNFYMDDDKHQERAEIVRLASSLEDEGSGDKIMAYVHEALRIDPVVSGVYRTAARDVIVGPTRINARERVFVSLAGANSDAAKVGPDASLPDYDRRTITSGFGEHGFLSNAFLGSTLPTIVGSILALKNIKRGPGNSGRLAEFKEDWHGGRRHQYLNSEGKITPFPDSLILQFDL